MQKFSFSIKTQSKGSNSLLLALVILAILILAILFSEKLLALLTMLAGVAR